MRSRREKAFNLVLLGIMVTLYLGTHRWNNSIVGFGLWLILLVLTFANLASAAMQVHRYLKARRIRRS